MHLTLLVSPFLPSLAEAAQAGGGSDALDAAVALYNLGGTDGGSGAVMGIHTSPSLRRAVHQLQSAQQPLRDRPSAQSSAAAGAAAGSLGNAGRSVIGGASSAASAELTPALPQTLPMAATLAVLAGAELDRPAFLDALILAACSLWECVKGGPIPGPPASAGGGEGGGTTPGVGGGHHGASHHHSNAGSPRGAMAGSVHTFGGSSAGGAASAASGSGYTASSLAGGKLPALRAHMVASFLSQSVLPRVRRFNAASAAAPVARRELQSKKADAQVLAEVSR
jgi:hypothetical protein